MRRLRLRLAQIGLVGLALASCSGIDSLETYAPETTDQFSRSYLELIRDREWEAVERSLDPELKRSDPWPALEQVSAVLTTTELDSIQLVGLSLGRAGADHRATLTYQARTPDGWLLAQVSMRYGRNWHAVHGVHVNPIPRPIGEINAFTFRGKGVVHYLVLLLAAASFGYIVYVLAVCLRSRFKRKWLWALLTLVAATRLQLDWSTGQIGYTVFFVQLFGVGAVKSGPFAPWVISVGFPVGALLTWRKVKSLEQADAAPIPVDVPVPAE